MSDVFPGEGWWMASDGKWYAPQLHHDPAYRAKYATPAPVEPDEAVAPAEPEATRHDDVEEVDDEPEAVAEVVTVADGDASGPEEDDSDPSSGWLDEAEPVVAAARPDPLEPAEPPEPEEPTKPSEPPAVPDAPEPVRSGAPTPVRGMPPPVVKPVEPPPSSTEPGPTFSDEAPPRDSIQWPELPDTESGAVPDPTPEPADVAMVGSPAPTDESATDQPGVDDSDDDDWVSHGPTDAVGSGPVTVAPPRPEPASVRPAFETKRPPSVVGQERPSRARLEVGRPIVEPTDLPTRATPSTISMESRPKAALTQSSTGLTEIRVYKEPAELVDRAIASVLFLSGLAMIVGTFVDWIREAGADTTGWERGDGIATVFAGVLGAAAAGPIFVGFRHIVPKTIAIVCGLIGAVVVGLVGLDVTSDSAAAGTSLAPGFWLTLAGSLAMIVAGVAERTSIR